VSSSNFLKYVQMADGYAIMFINLPGGGTLQWGTGRALHPLVGIAWLASIEIYSVGYALNAMAVNDEV